MDVVDVLRVVSTVFITGGLVGASVVVWRMIVAASNEPGPDPYDCKHELGHEWSDAYMPGDRRGTCFHCGIPNNGPADSLLPWKKKDACKTSVGHEWSDIAVRRDQRGPCRHCGFPNPRPLPS